MAPARPDRGFTLIEVMIAVVMLGIVVLGMTAASGGLIRSAGDDRRSSQAGAAAESRISVMRQSPDYAALDSFAGTDTDTPLPGWTRATVVTRIGGAGQANDFKRMTVTITGAGLPSPVVRSLTVAAP